MKYKIKNLINNRKTLYLVLSIVLVSVFTLTIAYAALNTVLKITGNAEVSAASWDIYLDNVQLVSGSVTQNKPTITDKTTASFSTTLTKPGDYYKFTVDVVNNGSIDAMIDNVIKLPNLTESQSKYIKYEIEYSTGASINSKQLLKQGSTKTLYVTVLYRTDLIANDLPPQTETLNLSFELTYTQANDDFRVEPGATNSIVKIVNGDFNTIGSEISIGNEHFYVISSTTNTVSMLSKYNLYVGGESPDGESWNAYGEEATGIQNSQMLGHNIISMPFKGTTAFSSTEKMGEYYNEYNGSIVEEYVNNYKLYLETLGIDIQEARLLTKEEADEFGCDTNINSCRNAPEFIYSTGYWLGSTPTGHYGNIYCIYGSAYYGSNIYNRNNSFGVRPVITISKS